jgi:low temperature requirement protein LtrA
MALAFILWWWYFDVARNTDARHIRSKKLQPRIELSLRLGSASGRRLSERRRSRAAQLDPKQAALFQVWNYAHLPLFVGIGIAGVGFRRAISLEADVRLRPLEAQILTSVVALLMVALISMGLLRMRHRSLGDSASTYGRNISLRRLWWLLGILARSCSAPLSWPFY